LTTYKITTQEELDELNADYLKHYPQETNFKWSGCNYYINQGKIEHESLGTAQSMHDCEACERIANFDTPTWFWNKEIEQRLRDIINDYMKRDVM